MKYLFALLTIFVSVFSLFAQNDSGYRIEVEVDNYQNEKIFLAHRYGEKTYATDTAYRKDNGYLFEDDEALPTGIYLVLLPPENKFVEFLISPDDQQFRVKTDSLELFDNLEITGSPANEVFLSYRRFMNEKVPVAQDFQAKIDAAASNKEKQQWQKKKDKIIAEVEKKQQSILAEYSDQWVGKIINNWIETPIPDTPKGEEEQQFRYRFYKDHFWDNYDWQEEGFVRSPYLLQKIEQYTDRLTSQDVDSLKIASDFILDHLKDNEPAFRYALTHLLNKYYKPKIIGHDEVFVHLAYKYYCGANPVATWISEDAKKKICDDAYMIRGVLIGNPAPRVSTQVFDYAANEWSDNIMNLYDVDADYIIVFLWKPGCPACKKMTEELKPFYEEYKSKGVEIFSISSATSKDLDKAKKDIEVKKPTWITTADPYLKARALQKFYGTSLPKLYLLDKDKKIIASRIGVEQLRTIIDKKASDETK